MIGSFGSCLGMRVLPRTLQQQMGSQNVVFLKQGRFPVCIALVLSRPDTAAALIAGRVLRMAVRVPVTRTGAGRFAALRIVRADNRAGGQKTAVRFGRTYPS